LPSLEQNEKDIAVLTQLKTRPLKDEKLLERIAQRIREIRVKNNVTQVEFYTETRVHIARIESGNTNISVSTLALICRYFNISLLDFFNKL